MATEKYKVEAAIELGAQKVTSGLDSVIKKLGAMQAGVRRISLGFDGLITRAVAVGAAYLGFSAITRGVAGLASGILEASSSAEAMQASLATVYAAVEKVSFKQATEDAGSLFRTLEKVAIVSTATAPELMQVFQGIYGPLRNAGLTLDQIVTTTNNAAVAASALGVDFAQASRDISAMARGTAGLDVKTFSLLQSMGLIKETTEQWNALAPDKRAKKLMDVMGKIGGQAAEAYGRTWKGLSSTFSDIMGAFKRAFGSAVFERLKGTLEKVNAYLLQNRERIEAYLRVLGERVGSIFDNVISNAGRMYRSAISHADAIRARVAELYAKFQELKPTILAGAKMAAVMQLGAFAFNAVIPVLTTFASMVAWLVGVIGAIGAAGGIGAWVSATLSAFGAAVAPLLAPLALVAVVVTALVLGLLRFKDTIWSLTKPLLETFKSIGVQLGAIFADLWAAFKPLLEVLGGAAIMAVIIGLRMLAWVIDKILLPPIRWLAELLRWLMDDVIRPVFGALQVVIEPVIDAMRWLGEAIGDLVGIISDAVGWVGDKLGAAGGAVKDFFTGSPEWEAQTKEFFKDPFGIDSMLGVDTSAATKPSLSELLGPSMEMARRYGIGKQASSDVGKMGRDITAAMTTAQRNLHDKEVLKRERAITHNDFRGSKITVKQEFREADPDNVWIQMRDGLEREAVARTRSGFADSLAR